MNVSLSTPLVLSRAERPRVVPPPVEWRPVMLAIAEAMGGPEGRAEFLRQWAEVEGPFPRLYRFGQAILRGLRGIAHFSWANAGENSLWELFFNNTAFAQAPLILASSSAGSIFVATHTATPGQTGNQQTNESGYPNYARVAVARSGAGWTITGNNPVVAENAAAITFPTSGSGGTTPESETYFSMGQETSGAGVIYGFAALSATLVVNNGITPSFAIDAATCNFT